MKCDSKSIKCTHNTLCLTHLSLLFLSRYYHSAHVTLSFVSTSFVFSLVASSRCFLVSSWILSILGLALIIVAFTVPPIIDKKLADGIKDATTLTVQSRNENSLSYRTFVDSLDPDAVPTYMKHFLYNLTNPEDFLNGDKPKFVELGPWVYRKVTKRVNVEFNRDTMGDYTVSFNPVQYYLFDAEQTAPGLSHETPITTLNVVFQILRHKGLGALVCIFSIAPTLLPIESLLNVGVFS